MRILSDRERVELRKTVLIVDRDLGFVFWLGSALGGAGYKVFPAKGVPEATALISELKLELDLLIVNSSLDGAGNLVDAVRYSRRELKSLSVRGDKINQRVS
jgi:hypothetical protein